MKKLFIFLSLFLIMGIFSNAQICQWAEKIGGSRNTSSIAVDGSWNVYVAGYFDSDTLNFNNSISLYNSKYIYGYYEGFIAKFNSSGTCLWAEIIAGDYSDNVVLSIVVDWLSNVYITGYFNSMCLFLIIIFQFLIMEMSMFLSQNMTALVLACGPKILAEPIMIMLVA